MSSASAIPDRPPRPDVLGFLHAIKSNPDDDTPRLVFADWLHDYGDESDAARGELLRLQVQAALLEPRSDPWQELQARSADLFSRWIDSWMGSLRSLAHARGYHRGLLQLHVQLRDLIDLKHPDLSQSEALAWVDSLLCYLGTWRQLAQAVSRSLLDGLVNLDLGGCRVGHEGIQVVVERGQFRLLRNLNLAASQIGQQALELLAGSALLSQLTRLDLDLNDLGSSALGPLLGSGKLGQLRHLGLAGNRLNEHAARALAGTPDLAGLTHLNLRTNSLGDEGAIALAESPLLGNLVWLDLSNNRVTGNGVRALRSSPFLKRLSTLRLERSLTEY